MALTDTAMTPTKATIENDDTHERFECLFNPTEYSLSMTNRWVAKHNKGRGMSHLEYTGGDNSVMKLQLFFDTVEPRKGGGEMRTSVRWFVEQLQKFMKPMVEKGDKKAKGGRPPYLNLIWGSNDSYKSIMEDMQVRYTLFSQGGDPIRCTVDVTLKGIEADQPGTNPTSFSEPGHKRREVQPHDTLALISFQEYGNPNRWRAIADANGMDDPLDLHPGQVLAIPPA